jgi:hypothetical protein
MMLYRFIILLLGLGFALGLTACGPRGGDGVEQGDDEQENVENNRNNQQGDDGDEEDEEDEEDDEDEEGN